MVSCTCEAAPGTAHSSDCPKVKKVCAIHNWQSEGPVECPYCWAGIETLKPPLYRYSVKPAVTLPYAIHDSKEQKAIALCWDQEKAMAIVDALNYLRW